MILLETWPCTNDVRGFLSRIFNNKCRVRGMITICGLIISKDYQCFLDLILVFDFFIDNYSRQQSISDRFVQSFIVGFTGMSKSSKIGLERSIIRLMTILLSIPT